MKNTQNEASNFFITNKFLAIYLFTIIILAIFLIPKVSARLFPFLPDNRLNTFVQEIQSQEMIDQQKYWEFREFYSPGSFIFNTNGLPQQSVSVVLNKANVSLSPQYTLIPFLAYSSPKLVSVDFLAPISNLEVLIPQVSKTQNSLLHKSIHEIIYKKDQSTLVMIFLKNPDEMKTVNGFLTTDPYIEKLTERYYWLNVTVITQ